MAGEDAKAAAIIVPIEDGQQAGTKEGGEELVNLMQPPPRIKKGKKGKKKGPAADALTQLEELEAKKDEVRLGGLFCSYVCRERRWSGFVHERGYV